MKTSYSFCLVLFMSTMPIHASLADVSEDAQANALSADQVTTSDINLNKDTEDFGPGGPGGGGFHPGGPGPGGPGGGGFHPGPGGPGPGEGGGFHPGPGGPGPGEGGGFHPGPGGPGPGEGGGFHPGPGGPGGFNPGPGQGPGRTWNPVPIRGGQYPGPSWNHPIFQRPIYNWNWNQVQLVTCTAQDEYGNQYPVTENDYVGFQYQQELNNIEDAALDMCYQDSGDQACNLLGCSPGY